MTAALQGSPHSRSLSVLPEIGSPLSLLPARAPLVPSALSSPLLHAQSDGRLLLSQEQQQQDANAEPLSRILSDVRFQFAVCICSETLTPAGVYAVCL